MKILWNDKSRTWLNSTNLTQGIPKSNTSNIAWLRGLYKPWTPFYQILLYINYVFYKHFFDDCKTWIFPLVCFQLHCSAYLVKLAWRDLQHNVCKFLKYWKDMIKFNAFAFKCTQLNIWLLCRKDEVKLKVQEPFQRTHRIKMKGR